MKVAKIEDSLGVRRKLDRKSMAEEFHSVFDESWVRDAMERKWSEALGPLLGEGAHFQTRLLRRHGLILKRSAPEFGDPDDPAVRSWISAMARIKEVSHALIPPFEVVVCSSAVSMVMPHGDQGPAMAAAHWQPVDELVDSFHQTLAGAGLILDDYVQLRARHGVPFVIDFSDLRFR